MKYERVYTSDDDAYGRKVNIDKMEEECDFCKEVKEILSVDVSDDEYMRFSCCRECFQKLFDRKGIVYEF